MIRSKVLSITEAELNHLFPFFLMFDLDFKILSSGTSMRKLFPEPTEGTYFTENWKVDRPLVDVSDSGHMERLLGKLIVISNRSNPNLRFKGQMEKLTADGQYVFLGSPWFNNSDQLIEHGLSMGDFAIHDSMTDLFHVLKNNEIANGELQEILKKVNEQKTKLIADQHSLQRKEKMLQAIAEATDELLSNLNLDEAVLRSLSLIGSAVEIDRICLYEQQPMAADSDKIGLRCEWKSILGQLETENSGQDVLYLNKLRAAYKGFLAKQTYQATVSELDDEDPLKMFMHEKNICSTLIVPIFVSEQFHGILGFNDCHKERDWTADEQSLFKSFANSIASAIERNETANAMMKANEQLKLFQGLINNSSDAVGVAHESGQMFYINKAASKRVGIEVEDCRKHNVRDFDGLLINKEGTWENNLAELKSAGSLVLEGENLDHTTGEVFSVETTFNYISLGGEGFVVANSRDISERKKNEKQLMLQEEKYRNIIANMNLGLLEVNLHEEIEYCNPSFTAISGYQLSEIEGKNAISLFGIGKQNQHLEEKLKDRLQGKADSYEALIRNKAGELRWWLISGAPTYNDNGEITGTVGIHLDITEQKKIEKKLELALAEAEAASAAKEAFLANMSHEIRTPLNGIIGMVRELSKLEQSDTQRPLIEGAKKASSHLLSIVNNILDLSKIEAGELSLNNSAFNLSNVIQDVKNILSNQFEEKGLRFETAIDTGLSESLIGDSSRIRQILLNIAGNSLKFTNEGFVKVSCKANRTTEHHQQIELKVRDSGIGMDQDFVDRIFTKFQQEDISSSRKYEGTGLGMVITKELIELMGGGISVTSKKGHGTEITIRLTLARANEQQEVLELNGPSDLISLKKKRLLLVEDNEMNRLVATQVLVPYQMEITEVENGAQAVEILKTEKFDVILMDLQMPIMGGLEATRIIRTELKVETPIIALSANAFQSEVDTCLKAGMNRYVTKPFDEQELVNAIRLEMSDKKAVTSNAATITGKSHSPEPHALYNLNSLKDMSRGNDAFVKKMLALFVDSVPRSTLDLEMALKTGDVESIRKLAHKLKPSLDNLGIASIHMDIRKLEKYDEGSSLTKELENLVSKVKDTLNRTAESIRQNELN